MRKSKKTFSSGSYDRYPDALEFYDHHPLYRDRPDVSFYVEEAGRSGGPVLELGCGTGRILIPSARGGVAITGIDNAERMLDLCRAKLEREKAAVRERVDLHFGSMASFELGKKYRLITTPFRSFQHLLTVEEQIACLHCVRAHLADEGLFILDVFNPYLPALLDDAYLSEVSEEPEFEMPDGRRVLRGNKIVSRDPLAQINEIQFNIYVRHPDGYEEVIVQRAHMRYIFRYEAEHLLVRCGFSIRAIYADYDRTPYGKKYPGELIVVAGKG